MRPIFLALLTGLLGVAVVPYSDNPAAASCAAPSLSVEGHDTDQRVRLVPGEEVTVTGRGFVEGCDDTGGSSASPLGCSGDDHEEIETPLTDIELVALQGQPTMKETSLATADAGTAEDDDLGQITWTFVVPRTLSPGPAVLKTVGSEPLPVRIVSPVIVSIE